MDILIVKTKVRAELAKLVIILVDIVIVKKSWSRTKNTSDNFNGYIDSKNKSSSRTCKIGDNFNGYIDSKKKVRAELQQVQMIKLNGHCDSKQSKWCI